MYFVERDATHEKTSANSSKRTHHDCQMTALEQLHKIQTQVQLHVRRHTIETDYATVTEPKLVQSMNEVYRIAAQSPQENRKKLQLQRTIYSWMDKVGTFISLE